jgi:hypothetical protein
VKAPSPSLAVPLQSVIYEQENSFVLVAQNGDFVRTPITTGRKNLYFIEVTNGLNSGDKIALSAISTNQGAE